MLRVLFLIVLAPLMSGISNAQSNRTLLPVDDAVKRPDFFTFRANLLSAIARRDSAAVLSIVHPDIKNGFGGDDGIEAFKKMWRIAESDSGLWKELGTVLALGGTFSEDEFVAPYTFSRWPSDVDSFEYVAVVGANVRVRAEPRPDAAIVGAVSFSILKVNLKVREVPEWTAIEMGDGRNGYIASGFVRSPVDYRAAFSYSSGRWQLRMFLAGD